MAVAEAMDIDSDESDHNEPASSEIAAEAKSPATSTTPSSPATLSKSWKVSKTYGSIYTGGKIDLALNGSCLLSMIYGDVKLTSTGTAAAAKEEKEEDGTPATATTTTFASSTSVRGDDYEPDDDGIDADAITAYGVSHTSALLTVSQNSMIRLYAIGTVDEEEEEEGSSGGSRRRRSFKITLQKTFGKSGHTLPVTDVRFHASGMFAVTASVDGSCRVWDVRGGFCTHVLRSGQGRAPVTGVAWHPSVQHLIVAVGGSDGSIGIHNLRDTSKVVTLNDHVSAVTCLQWMNQGTLFCTSGRDAVMNLWRVHDENVMSYKRLHTLPVYEQVEGMVVLSKSGSDVIVVAGTKGLLRMFKVEKDSLKEVVGAQSESDAFGEARGGYSALLCNNTASSSVTEFVAADAEQNITYFHLTNRGRSSLTTVRTMVGHNDEILDLKVIPNQARPQIVVATNSSQVRLFYLDDFSCHVLDRHSATVLCVDVSPCGRFIATCGKDKTMRLWMGNASVAVASGHTEAVGSTALSRKSARYNVTGKAARNGGGAFCVTASMDRTLKRWNLPGVYESDEHEEDVELKAFCSTRAHEKDINIVSVAPNDSLVATGSQDKSVKLWKATDLSLVATLKGHRRGVWDAQFSPYDRIIATASGDKTIKLWSLGDYSCVRTFQGHIASVLRIRFLNGGLQLVSSGADGLVKLWTVRTNESEATMDEHNDKVWALDLTPDGKELVTGGADSQVIVWKDETKAVEAAKNEEREELILVDQKLSNHLRHGEFDRALEISLQRDKPHQTLKILNSILEAELLKGLDGQTLLKSYAKKWSDEEIARILRYCREWNTRTRNAHVALLTLKVVVTTLSAHRLALMDRVPEILAGIVPYAERHFDRIDRLHSNSYIFDFALSSLGAVEQQAHGVEFSAWEKESKLVLPPKLFDGKIDTGGNTLVQANHAMDDSNSDGNEIVTLGDSDDDSSDEYC